MINGQLIPFHTIQVRDFVEALESGQEPAITGRDALKSLRILLAVYESSRTGQPVRFAPVDGFAKSRVGIPTLVPAGVPAEAGV